MHIAGRPIRGFMIATVAFALAAGPARADIYRWAYVDPLDPAHGKQQSAQLTAGGSGVDPVPKAVLANRDLTMAYLINKDLSGAIAGGAKLVDADLSGSLLVGARLASANLTGATFTDADIRMAELTNAIGVTVAQLQSTKSYQQSDLSGVRFNNLNLANANFRGVDLTSASLLGANLSGVDFTNAKVQGVNFGDALSRGFTVAALQSTASFASRDLSGVTLGGNLSGLNFVNFNLDRISLSGSLGGTNFSGANLNRAKLRFLTGATDVDFSGANLVNSQLDYSDLRGANFRNADLSGATLDQSNVTGADFTGANIKQTHLLKVVGFTLANLYSTANYQSRDLSDVILSYRDLRNADLEGVDLSRTSFGNALLDGANFNDANIREAVFLQSGLTSGQLYSTASYKSGDLAGVKFISGDFSGFNFAGMNLRRVAFSGSELTNVDFSGADLTGSNFNAVGTLAGTDFTDAEVRGVTFDASGLSLQQIYSTASYQSGSLAGVRLWGLDLTGANFAGLDLTDAVLNNTRLAGADLSAVDLRGAKPPSLGGGVIALNAIGDDGRIHGLQLAEGRSLTIRDYDTKAIAVTIENQFAMDASSTLELVFDDDEWSSTVSFAPEIDVALGGTLRLRFDATTEVSEQVGREFRIFDWNGVTPQGTFQIDSRQNWDLSALYTLGTIRLLAAADFNGDGVVDGGDFLQWQRGGSPTPFSASDLNVWKASYGASSLAGTSLAVPEPACLALLALSAAFLGISSRSVPCRRSRAERVAPLPLAPKR